MLNRYKMAMPHKKIPLFILLLGLFILLAAPAIADFSWNNGFDVEFTYEEAAGNDAGNSHLTMTMTIPKWTPLLARQSAIDSSIAALRKIWEGDGLHMDVMGVFESQVPLRVQRISSGIDGVSFVMAIMDAFEQVEESGFSRFQDQYTVSVTERFDASTQAGNVQYQDLPAFWRWEVPGESLMSDAISEKMVIASLVNYTASVLSFRSEYQRFPRSLAEVRETGHLLIQPINPYSSQPMIEINSVSAGNITYNIVNSNTVVLLTYLEVGDTVEVVRREINSSGAFDYLYRQTAGLTDLNKQVARYAFQISQIINEYYYEYLELPYSVPQCEAEGFAYVTFMNPYTRLDAQQASGLSGILPGDYSYHRVNEASYLLVAYGSAGEQVFSFSTTFGTIGPTMSVLSAP